MDTDAYLRKIATFNIRQIPELYVRSLYQDILLSEDACILVGTLRLLLLRFRQFVTQLIDVARDRKSVV